MVEIDREYLDKRFGKDILLNSTTINLYNNQITKIDSNTFKNLTKLERLFLGANEIEELEVKIFETLSNLKELSSFNNKLKSELMKIS